MRDTDTEWDREAVGSKGFTLVELLVAMAITAIVSIAIFGLFNTTSEALYEADSLAQSVDSARFALEKVRDDLKQAGAFSTPDTAWDPQVRPTPGRDFTRGGQSFSRNNYRVAGIVTYGGWQNYADDVMPDNPVDILNANQDGSLTPQFDGIVVMGAYDYPFLFEVGNLDQQSVDIFDHPRGLDKLARRNLFNLERPSTAFTGSNSPLEAATTTNRLVRLRDPNGFYQFADVAGLNGPNPDVTINFSNPLFFKPPGAQDIEFGFPPRTRGSSGERYYASLIDAFWYRVIQDPSNPNNFQLVRQRLDAGDVRTDLAGGNWGNFDPAGTTVGSPAVIAERVVDFQIWFDCTESNDGAIQELDWPTGWNPPDGTDRSDSDPHHGCMNPNSSEGGNDAPPTVKARIGHVRLSIRTESEREDLRHEPFPSAGKTGTNRQLETFDIDPNQPGATRVYTVQSDFELTNYAVRNVTP